jgi:hypothetical protein
MLTTTEIKNLCKIYMILVISLCVLLIAMLPVVAVASFCFEQHYGLLGLLIVVLCGPIYAFIYFGTLMVLMGKGL